jgi:hypothetical protein
VQKLHSHVKSLAPLGGAGLLLIYSIQRGQPVDTGDGAVTEPAFDQGQRLVGGRNSLDGQDFDTATLQPSNEGLPYASPIPEDDYTRPLFEANPGLDEELDGRPEP